MAKIGAAETTVIADRMVIGVVRVVEANASAVDMAALAVLVVVASRSEERRVGKEC